MYAIRSYYVVAQFHEWMSGCGILYLKRSLPQAATIFTTHATIMGRTLSGHYKPLYEEMEHYNVEDLAREYKIVSKHRITSYNVCYTKLLRRRPGS